MGTIMQYFWIFIILLIVAVIYNWYEKQKDRDINLKSLQSQMDHQQIVNKRLQSQIENKCPNCGEHRLDNQHFCPKCEFTYVNGAYCSGCGKYKPVEQLKEGITMDLLPSYECHDCEGKVFKKTVLK